MKPTYEQLLEALKNILESASEDGCDGLYVVDGTVIDSAWELFTEEPHYENL